MTKPDEPHGWPIVEFIPHPWLARGQWILDKATGRCYVGPGVVDAVWLWLVPAEGSA